jgi:hypothetical protein
MATDGNFWMRGLGWIYDYINQSVRTDSNPTFGNIYSNGWFRNNNSGQGLYHQSTGMHWYSNNGYWKAAGGGYGYGGIQMYNNYESDTRGYAGYWDGSGFGMLNETGNWQIRIERGNAHMELYRITYGNDFRPYITYDRDDTGFYSDPNGTSNFARFTDRTKNIMGLTAKYNNPRSGITGDTNYWVGAMGWGTTDMNTVFDWGTGFFDTWGSIPNSPGDTSHYVGINAMHYTNGSSRYGWQMAGGPTSTLWWRNTWDSFSGWRRIIDSGNIGSQSVANASNFNNGSSYSSGTNIYIVDGSGNSLRLHAYSGGVVQDWRTMMHLRNYAGVDHHGMIDTGYFFGRFLVNIDRYSSNAGLGNYGESYNAALNVDGSSNSYAIAHYGGIINVSDRRYKHQILTIKNPLEKIAGINGVTFYMDQMKIRNAGVIAQDVKVVFPEIVSGTEDTKYGVNYDGLTALLIEAVKEQQVIINELKQRIENLENQ